MAEHNPDTQPMVTQAARDAAADLAEDVLSGWCHIGGNDVPAIRNGFWDDDQTDLGLLVKAFARFEAETLARHRTQHTARSADVGRGPVALLHEHAESGDVEVELFHHGAGCLTDADREAGWTETELYALATPSADDGGLRSALSALLARDIQNTCQHEDTHRGGAIWEICDGCGAKWADDEGGKPEWSDPPEWVAARQALSRGK